MWGDVARVDPMLIDTTRTLQFHLALCHLRSAQLQTVEAQGQHLACTECGTKGVLEPFQSKPRSKAC